MRRAVEKYVEDPLAEQPPARKIKQGDTLEVHAAWRKRPRETNRAHSLLSVDVPVDTPCEEVTDSPKLKNSRFASTNRVTSRRS